MIYQKAKITVEKGNVTGEAGKNLFGSFVEHLGRCVYNGIYEPDHPLADEFGFRKDVMALVRELNIPVIRYPGGNFVSNYRWEDGIGPVEQRPKRLDLAWRSTETNAVGVNEFSSWCKRVGAEPVMTINLGTRGIDSALDLLEYCNHPAGTYLSDLRISHGYREPHNIRYWCLGNEMDGDWQVGHKTAYEYGRLACETARAMRQVDPNLQLLSCGSSHTMMDTFPDWEVETLSQTYDYVDYISLHQYFENTNGSTKDFLAQSMETDRFIRTVIAVCDYVKAKKRGKKDIMLSFDEWNVWYHSKNHDDDTMKNDPWNSIPHLLEDVYTFEDSLLVGCMLLTFLKHADRLKMACMAQLCNVIAPIMTENGGGVCRQTTFYPFLHVSRYGRGKVLNAFVDCPKYDSENFSAVPYLETALVEDEQTGDVTLFAVNRSTDEPFVIDIRMLGFDGYRVKEHIVMHSPDLQAVNTPKTLDTVKPVSLGVNSAVSDGDRFEIRVDKASWNVIRFCRDTAE